MILAGARNETSQPRAQIRLLPSLSSFSPHCISHFICLSFPKYQPPRYHSFIWVQRMWREKSYHHWRMIFSCQLAEACIVTPACLYCGNTRLALITNLTQITSANAPMIFRINCSKGMNKLCHSLLTQDGAPILPQTQ